MGSGGRPKDGDAFWRHKPGTHFQHHCETSGAQRLSYARHRYGCFLAFRLSIPRQALSFRLHVLLKLYLSLQVFRSLLTCLSSLDAWGRGYSDSPLSVRYDIRLFTLQILFAVVSSTLSWTGASQSFSIIGYSLGGSIGMAFASRFPTMVESIVLLGPGGLIRTVPEGYGSIFFRYQQWIPSFYLHRLIARTLGLQARKQYDYPSEPKVNQLNPVEKLHAIWQWQFDQHEGFIHSFANTAQNGPIQHQHEEWQRACDIICGKGSPDVISRLRDSQVLVVCGRNDEVIIFDELVEDLEKLLPNHVVIRTVDGGHEFPIVSGEATSNLICEFLSI